MNKLSNTSINRYLECPEKFNLHYNKKFVPKTKGSWLYFGVALDVTLNSLLMDFNSGIKSSDVYKKIFDEAWAVGKNNHYKEHKIEKDPYIIWTKTDFDEDVLEQEDIDLINGYADELRIGVGNLNDFVKAVFKDDNGKYINIEEPRRRMMTYIHYLCVRRKAHMFIDAYIEQVLPQFQEVLAVQIDDNIDNGEGDKLRIKPDLVAKLIDGKNALIDNKTSGFEYEKDKAKKDQQLNIYREGLDTLALDATNNDWHLTIDMVGFVVIMKSLNKTTIKTCKKCGVINESTHKTCNEGKGKNRCHGEFEIIKEMSVRIDFILNYVDDFVTDMIMDNVSAVNHMMRESKKTGIYPKNLHNCINKYNKKCEFYDLCHSGNDKDLETRD